MKNCCPSKTPIIKGDKLRYLQEPLSDAEKTTMKEKSYATVVESFNYAQLCTHSDLSFVTE